MTDQELQSLEADLRRLKPAAPPEALAQRLKAEPELEPVVPSRAGAPAPAGEGLLTLWGRRWLRWLMPAGAVAVIAGVMWWHGARSADDTATRAAVKEDEWVLDEIEVDRQLMGAYEGVVELAGGVPVRFRCYDWQEDLIMRGADGSMEIEESNPRWEIVPVALEVY